MMQKSKADPHRSRRLWVCLMIFFQFLSFQLIGIGEAATRGSAVACRKVYAISKSEYINLYDLSEVVHTQNNKIMGLALVDDIFLIVPFNNMQQARDFYSEAPKSQRTIVSDLLKSRTQSIEKSIAWLEQLGEKFNAEVSFRIKDSESLKKKIFDRALQFKKHGQFFSLNDLADVIGVRITVQPGSPLLTLESTQHWASLLKVNPDSIREIEIKGSSSDQAKGRFYSATHLKIEMSHLLELQVMTESMAVWHKWDHTHVYKPRRSFNQRTSSLLKIYSQHWVKLISQLDRAQSQHRNTILRVSAREAHLSEVMNLHDYNTKLLNKIGLKEDLGLSDTHVRRLQEIFFESN